MYVAITGKRQADNTVIASIVSVFPASVAANVPIRPEPAAGRQPDDERDISEINAGRSRLPSRRRRKDHGPRPTLSSSSNTMRRPATFQSRRADHGKP